MGPILVTGFEPFGGETVNPSQLVVESLPASVPGAALVPLVLPVDGVKAPLLAFEAVSASQSVAVVSLGQSGFPLVQLERVFINLFHTSEAPGEPVVPGGPDGLFATLDYGALIRGVAGHPVCGSLSAGTYVCNALGYQLVHRYGASAPSTFVHLPFLPEQRPSNEGTMSLETQRAAVLAILEAVAAQVAA